MIITYPVEFTPFYNKLEHKCLFVVKMRVNQLKIGDRPRCQRPKMSGHNCFCFSGVSCSKSRKLFKSQHQPNDVWAPSGQRWIEKYLPDDSVQNFNVWGKNERVHPGVMFPSLPWPLQSCLTWKLMHFFFPVWSLKQEVDAGVEMRIMKCCAHFFFFLFWDWANFWLVHCSNPTIYRFLTKTSNKVTRANSD